ncbi:MAG: 30S ribosomal protein S6 [Bacilli bacterium]|nr:30S ribosomal protein S6 [Bacilli bacterium]
MKKYEIMYIVKAGLEEEARVATIEKVNSAVTKNGGKVLDVKEMGLRDLAYPIKDEIKGYYVVLTVEAEVETVNEFDRLTKLNNNVLRHLILVA